MSLRSRTVFLEQDRVFWPVLLLFLVVLIPTAGVVWMMRVAMRNEGFAVRQRLEEAYRVQLESVKRTILENWSDRASKVDEIVSRNVGRAEAFRQAVVEVGIDGLLIFDSEGSLAYPQAKSESQRGTAEEPSAWRIAYAAEFMESNLEKAVEFYSELSRTGESTEIVARAEQAWARCLLRMGRSADAVPILRRLSEREQADDGDGRDLSVDASLRLLEMEELPPLDRNRIAARLEKRLNNYERALQADQRRFAIHRLMELLPNQATFPTLEAEEVAEAFLTESNRGARTNLDRTSDEAIWRLKSDHRRFALLMKRESIEVEVASLLRKQVFPDGVRVELGRPGSKIEVENPSVSVALGPMLADWKLALIVNDQSIMQQTIKGRTAFFAWVAAALVASTLSIALLLAGFIKRQMRIARLKNDLVATVSHELKTPLTSIRLLVDTLLAGDSSNQEANAESGRTREYLEMISRENDRLSRVIDNFLSFSRLERGKQPFELVSIDARTAVEKAVESVRERFAGDASTLKSQLEVPLPVKGDAHALTTVIVNLLDNAWKYSDRPKHVLVQGIQAGEYVAVSVQDNGIGMTPRTTRRIFERFYQADQSLTRSQGGCGLGLSIVKYIVEAHGGSIEVSSRHGEGSTFTLRLPLDTNRASGPSVDSHRASEESPSH